jgi:hypothetical protein
LKVSVVAKDSWGEDGVTKAVGPAGSDELPKNFVKGKVWGKDMR